MQTTLLLKKGWAVGTIVLFVAVALSPTFATQASVSQMRGKTMLGAQGFDMVIIWGTFEEKVRKFPLLSLEVRNRDPWDNRTLTVFGLFKEGTSFHVYLIKAYWVECVRLRSLHLGLVGNTSLFAVATGQVNVYQ